MTPQTDFRTCLFKKKKKKSKLSALDVIVVNYAKYTLCVKISRLR